MTKKHHNTATMADDFEQLLSLRTGWFYGLIPEFAQNYYKKIPV
jgi:hypothetical protein